MSKPIEKLKKQLLELSEVVNAFKSEAVQVKILDKLLDAMFESEKQDADNSDTTVNRRLNGNSSTKKKPGATKVLNQLLNTNYFNTPHSISAIAEYCKKHFDSEFKTSALSGILLKLSNENKLKRQRNDENHRFEYVKV